MSLSMEYKLKTCYYLQARISTLSCSSGRTTGVIGMHEIKCILIFCVSRMN
jgi:hypothetical protein